MLFVVLGDLLFQHSAAKYRNNLNPVAASQEDAIVQIYGTANMIGNNMQPVANAQVCCLCCWS
jgi:hypothetical protein